MGYYLIVSGSGNVDEGYLSVALMRGIRQWHQRGVFVVDIVDERYLSPVALTRSIREWLRRWVFVVNGGIDVYLLLILVITGV